MRNSAIFGSQNPLWLEDWASTIGTLPADWRQLITLNVVFVADDGGSPATPLSGGVYSSNATGLTPTPTTILLGTTKTAVMTGTH